MASSKFLGVLIAVDGILTQKSYGGLTDLQRDVGGWIEMVPLGRDGVMYINEEGKLRRLPRNDKATLLFGNYLGTGDRICGPAVIVGPPDREGNDTDITPTVRALITVL